MHIESHKENKISSPSKWRKRGGKLSSRVHHCILIILFLLSAFSSPASNNEEIEILSKNISECLNRIGENNKNLALHLKKLHETLLEKAKKNKKIIRDLKVLRYRCEYEGRKEEDGRKGKKGS